MRSAPCIAILWTAAVLSGCGGPLSSRAVRQQIVTLGDAGLATEDVRIERIISQASNRAVAEATVQMAFEFERDAAGVWQIVAVRIGEDDWVDMERFMAAYRQQQIEETASNLRMLANGVQAYRRENGGLPQASDADPLPDLLHPLFIPDLVRQDAWGADFAYEPSIDAFRLRSSGPDRTWDTPDDIEVTESASP